MIKLDSYTFPRIHVEANPNHEPECLDGFKYEIDIKNGIKQSEDKGSFSVMVNVKIEPNDNCQAPYAIDVMAVGFFNVSDDVPEDDKEKLAVHNGSSVLYGAIRDFVITLTSRGPWESIQLPLHYFSKDTRSTKKDKSKIISPK